jgi:hypothetical protein
MAKEFLMSPPPDMPLWRRALALVILITGLLFVCAATLAGMLHRSWVIPVGGIVGGLGCGVLGCAIVAQRIRCGRCGRSIICVGGRPRNCPIRNCTRCGAPFFSDSAGEAGAVRKKSKRLLLMFGALLVLLYVGSYVALSRRGYAEADQYNMKGFYYFFPADSDAWRLKNYSCVYLFWPLNVVDRWLGLGRSPASEPLWGLSK